MPFHLTTAAVPKALKTEDFRLRPIRGADARLDYEAIMESREFLRLWEQSTWPEDGFTEEENREDLVKLEQRHFARASFAYTVMNETEMECLGCVYIFPIDADMFRRSKISPTADAEWTESSAAVFFWVRTSRLAESLDRKLLDVLRQWLNQAWHFENYLFVTSEAFTQQVDMIESAGLRRKFLIDDPKASGRFMAYGG